MAGAPFINSVQVDWARVPSPKEYPFSLAAVKGLGKVQLHKHVTYLVGENGSGKSTLLEALATSWGLNPEGGSGNFNFNTRNSHSDLGDYLRVAKSGNRPSSSFFLRAESFFNVATEIERLDEGSGEILGGYGGKSLHEQSHGESFLALFLHRLHGQGLYLFDEPEAALSPMRQMSVLARIHHLVQEECQFIIATHSPIILAYPGALILEISAEGVKSKSYDETDTYRVMHDFMVSPERSVRALLRS